LYLTGFPFIAVSRAPGITRPKPTGQMKTQSGTAGPALMIDFLNREKLLETAGAYIVWGGVKHYAAALAEKLEKAGAWNELIALLPKAYEPPVVAVVEDDEAVA